ncbi:MAG: hypothetical protein SGPRY_007441, partial [Prymnesium sp.]
MLLLVGALALSPPRPPVPSTRRAVVAGAGLSLLPLSPLSPLSPLPASAKAKRADEYAPVVTATEKYASGFVRKRTSNELRRDVIANVFEPLEEAYNRKDYDAVSALFTPDAKIVDGTKKKAPLQEGRGADFGADAAKGPAYSDVKLTPRSIVT